MIEWVDLATMPPGYSRVWLYGPAGSGKTTVLGYFPKPFMIWCHNEGSEVTLRGAPFRGVRIGKPTPQHPRDEAVPVRADMEQLLDMMLASAARGTFHDDFGLTIAMDSFSHYNDLVITEIAAGGKKGDGMDQQKWGKLRTHYLHLRDVFWRLPAHVIFTSFELVKTVGDRVVHAGPYIQGSAADLLPGSCDALGYCETSPSGERLIWFRKCGDFPARHRYPGVDQGPFPNHELWSRIAPALGWT